MKFVQESGLKFGLSDTYATLNVKCKCAMKSGRKFLHAKRSVISMTYHYLATWDMTSNMTSDDS